MKKVGPVSPSGQSSVGVGGRSTPVTGTGIDPVVDKETRKPGRPRAKHSDKENYAQMSLYIRREIRNKTMARLFEQGLEFSALVESLLESWLDGQDKLKGIR